MVTGRRIEAAHRRPRRDLERRPPHAPAPSRPLPVTTVASVFNVVARRRRQHGLLREQDQVLAVGAVVARRDRHRRDRRGQPGAGARNFVGDLADQTAQLPLPAPLRARRRRPRPRLHGPGLPPCRRGATDRSGRARQRRSRRRRPCAGHTAIILTADHGGRGASHRRTQPAGPTTRIPFMVWGAGRRPRRRPLRDQPDLHRPRAASHVDVRRVRRSATADVANLALDLLELPAVAGQRARRRLRTWTHASCARSAARRVRPRVEPAAVESLRLLHHHRRRADPGRGSRGGRGRASARSRG